MSTEGLPMSNLQHAGALSRHLTTRQMRMLLAIN